MDGIFYLLVRSIKTMERKYEEKGSLEDEILLPMRCNFAFLVSIFVFWQSVLEITITQTAKEYSVIVDPSLLVHTS